MRAFIAIILCSLFLVSSFAFAQDIKPHYAKTDAEKALVNILQINKNDHSNLTSFIWKYKPRDIKKDKDFDKLFTKAIQNAWVKYYTNIPKEPEGGRFVGFDFIMCGNGDFPKELLYATVKTKDDLVYIAVIDTRNKSKSPSDITNPYIMKKDNNIWKLDGVSCFKSPTTNFHYTD